MAPRLGADAPLPPDSTGPSELNTLCCKADRSLVNKTGHLDLLATLRKAAEDFLDAEVEIHAAGRTDAGVHARAQVAHLRVRPKSASQRRFPPPDAILGELNERLPADVCILDVSEADNSFHARHDALARTYVYQISTRRTAFAKKHVWWVRDTLNTSAMSRAARMLVGRHYSIHFPATNAAR